MKTRKRDAIVLDPFGVILRQGLTRQGLLCQFGEPVAHGRKPIQQSDDALTTLKERSECFGVCLVRSSACEAALRQILQFFFNLLISVAITVLFKFRPMLLIIAILELIELFLLAGQ